MVSDFLSAISNFVGEDTWSVLASLAPDDVEVERSDEVNTDATVEEFLLQMSDAESVATARTRVVWQTSEVESRRVASRKACRLDRERGVARAL
ncbi:MAG TPA: hypothetical protein VF148_05115 [Acidimicrobiia bacterium]